MRGEGRGPRAEGEGEGEGDGGRVRVGVRVRIRTIMVRIRIRIKIHTSHTSDWFHVWRNATIVFFKVRAEVEKEEKQAGCPSHSIITPLAI